MMHDDDDDDDDEEEEEEEEDNDEDDDEDDDDVLSCDSLFATESSRRTSSVLTTFLVPRLSLSWSAASRPSCGSVDSPSPSTTPVSSSANATSVSAVRS